MVTLITTEAFAVPPASHEVQYKVLGKTVQETGLSVVSSLGNPWHE